MTDQVITDALAALGKAPPADETVCLYTAGVLDSADLMQLILEIALETARRIDFAELMSGPVSVARIRAALEAAAG